MDLGQVGCGTSLKCHCWGEVSVRKKMTGKEPQEEEAEGIVFTEEAND